MDSWIGYPAKKRYTAKTRKAKRKQLKQRDAMPLEVICVCVCVLTFAAINVHSQAHASMASRFHASHNPATLSTLFASSTRQTTRRVERKK